MIYIRPAIGLSISDNTCYGCQYVETMGETAYCHLFKCKLGGVRCNECLKAERNKNAKPIKTSYEKCLEYYKQQ